MIYLDRTCIRSPWHVHSLNLLPLKPLVAHYRKHWCQRRKCFLLISFLSFCKNVFYCNKEYFVIYATLNMWFSIAFGSRQVIFFLSVRVRTSEGILLYKTILQPWHLGQVRPPGARFLSFLCHAVWHVLDVVRSWFSGSAAKKITLHILCRPHGLYRLFLNLQ